MKRRHLQTAVAASACLITLTACERAQPETWTGWIYPDAANLTDSRELGSFDTFEACHRAALRIIELMPYSTTPAFECGKNCRLDEALALHVCEETRDS